MTLPRLLVCGGRDYANKAYLFAILNNYSDQAGGFSVVIHGAARGADSLAGEWASYCGIPIEEYPADWTKDGRAAGPIRNARMIREGKPDLVIAFPGGRGTADMVRQSRLARIPVLIIP